MRAQTHVLHSRPIQYLELSPARSTIPSKRDVRKTWQFGLEEDEANAMYEAGELRSGIRRSLESQTIYRYA
jgi:hypothetical protein